MAHVKPGIIDIAIAALFTVAALSIDLRSSCLLLIAMLPSGAMATTIMSRTPPKYSTPHGCNPVLSTSVYGPCSNSPRGVINL